MRSRAWDGSSYFNSNMVRLKDSKKFHFLFPFSHFNSNMVRLKVSQAAATIAGAAIFQFQYGSIKRTEVGDKQEAEFISIPIWFD